MTRMADDARTRQGVSGTVRRKRPLSPLLALLLTGVVLLAAYPALADLRLPFESPEHARIRRNVWFYGMRGTIRGRVTDALGRPVAGVELLARFRHPATGAPGEGRTQSDAHGRYEIQGLDAREFSIMAFDSKGSYLPSTSPRADLRTVGYRDGIDVTIP